jgi:hypothetical protein
VPVSDADRYLEGSQVSALVELFEQFDLVARRVKPVVVGLRRGDVS